jgi:dTDP-4-amino-4,6-dideoxygalactose transaminase
MRGDTPVIAFNRPHLTGREFEYIEKAVRSGQLSGNGMFTRACHAHLERKLASPRVLLTHSCTAALEMAALLLDLAPGDEVIMPSFTFVSTANAFVLRGAVPVFVDISADTLTLDPVLVERAITPRTRAIVPVHYAGVACDMDALIDIAKRHDLVVIEDAAQALGSTYRGRPLGGLGHLAAISFHETKNVIAGEGGALIVNDIRFAARAEILWEKGTNRAGFFRGEAEFYTWVDVGSSFLPSEVTAAFLLAQLEQEPQITAARLELWNEYFRRCEALSAPGVLQRPYVPGASGHNAHMFYVLLARGLDRAAVLASLNAHGVNAVFHYVPLHSSPAGVRFGRTASAMDVTDDVASRIVRLPLWVGMPADAPSVVVDALRSAVASQSQ